MPRTSIEDGPAPTAPGTSRPLRRFAFVLLGSLAVFYSLASTAWFRERIFDPVLGFEARLSAFVAAGLGLDAHADARTIRSGEFLIELQRGCDALEPAVLFALAVIASPASMPHKMTGILAGTLALFGLNVVRIVSLVAVSARRPKAFELVHMEWQVAFVLIGIVAWAAWAAWSTRRAREASRAAA